jgi:hypothetical protein
MTNTSRSFPHFAHFAKGNAHIVGNATEYNYLVQEWGKVSCFFDF